MARPAGSACGRDLFRGAARGPQELLGGGFQERMSWGAGRPHCCSGDLRTQWQQAWPSSAAPLTAPLTALPAPGRKHWGQYLGLQDGPPHWAGTFSFPSTCPLSPDPGREAMAAEMREN